MRPKTLPNLSSLQQLLHSLFQLRLTPASRRSLESLGLKLFVLGLSCLLCYLMSIGSHHLLSDVFNSHSLLKYLSPTIRQSEAVLGFLTLSSWVIFAAFMYFAFLLRPTILGRKPK